MAIPLRLRRPDPTCPQPAVPATSPWAHLDCRATGLWTAQVLVLVRRSARGVVPLAQLGRLLLFRYAHAVRRIKGLAFGHHRPRQMQQLARGGAAGDLHRLASRA
jgi:hypothetical protein